MESNFEFSYSQWVKLLYQDTYFYIIETLKKPEFCKVSFSRSVSVLIAVKWVKKRSSSKWELRFKCLEITILDLDSRCFAEISLIIVSILENILKKTLENVAGHDFSICG